MSLKSAIRDFMVRKELRKLEEKKPMIRKILNWLTDPAATWRKRKIALAAALIAGACRGVAVKLRESCAEALIDAASAWCSLNPDTWANVVEVANGLVQAIQPGMDLAAVAFLIIGVLHARQKGKP